METDSNSHGYFLHGFSTNLLVFGHGHFEKRISVI